MNKDALGTVVEDRWTALAAEQTTGERSLRVSQLPVDSSNGALALAVDHDGHRHLLVPIHAHRKVRPGLDGPVLRLHKRALEDEEAYQTYADLACLRTDLNDLFTELCVDVLGAARELPENPVKAMYRVLDRWKALFRAHGTVLGPDQLAGMYGELLVLRRLLQKDSSAHRLWRGPERHRHDFTAGKTAVEVKATTASEGRRPRIHGLDQLEAPQGGTLCLAWFRLQRAAGDEAGAGFVDLIEETLRLCDDERTLLDLLAAAGYNSSDADHYRDVRFVISEERWYRVDADFPGLTTEELGAAGVPVSILDVEYTIDLSSETPASLTSEEVAHLIKKMIEESV
ncbi:PD-(D/E)XK motif protein [Streptomyces panaciradicis]|uniref:PD-(D/E)XK motif protein n=1 Tax=Streptomyces panaciradicis TaxID=1470261 RepID=UPI00201CCCE7|nr:PD-(D/E)XK motif protein [Streptomyces panaciradicis]MCL6669785.1 PD-(D/E)XK motif protein [Streptomyces panaciradicis]